MKQIYHITMIVFVQYNVTYRYIVHYYEHPDDYAFVKQNIPGADKNLLPVLVLCLICGIHAECSAISAFTSSTEREQHFAIFSMSVSPYAISWRAVAIQVFFSVLIAASLHSR